MTTIPDSTMALAKAYLYNQTLAAPLFQPPTDPQQRSVLVCYDEPGPYLADDIVTFGAVHWHPAVSSGVGSGGKGWLEERYEIELIVDCFVGGDNGKAAYERAVELFNGVIQVVRADPSLGDLVLVAKPGPAVVTTTHEEGHKGWIARIDGHIECFQVL